MSAIVDFKGLREGVAAVATPRGLLFHDAWRWRLYLVQAGLGPQAAFDFLGENGLVEGAPLPPLAPRSSQMFSVGRDQAPDAGFSFAEEARFSCSACGSSCRSFHLGPLLPADVERLLGLDWSGTPHAPERFFIDRQGAALGGELLRDGREVFLRREGGACQFLQPDNLCEVHARFGAAAKPHMCRAFPILLRASPGGVVAGLRLAECSQAEAGAGGPRLADDPGAVRALWNELSRVTLLPPLVWLAPGALAGWDDYQVLERRLLDAGPAGSGLRFLQRSLDALGARSALPACAPEALALLRAWALPPGLPVAPAAGLDAAALALEERLARLALFSKDAFEHPDLQRGLAHLLVAAHLSRERALDQAGREGAAQATARHLNDAARFVSTLLLRAHLAASGLDPLAVAAALGA